MLRTALVRALAMAFGGAICLAACGPSSSTSPPTPVELAIAYGLLERFGVAVDATCTGLYPPCVARFPDGLELPIDLRFTADGWDWHVRGRVISTEAIERYLHDEVADLGAPQDVRCTPHVRAVVGGDRIVCRLGRGGSAFVTVRADGATSVEIVLDPAAAIVRSEQVTPEREREIEQTSRALAHMADDEDDDEGLAATDAGAPGDPR